MVQESQIEKGDKADETIKWLRKCFDENLETILQSLGTAIKEMGKADDDSPLHSILLQESHFSSSLFMPFMLFLNKEKQMDHWPVAGPIEFNCRIIKHGILDELREKILKQKLSTSSQENCYVVPFKIDNSSVESKDVEFARMNSLFADMREEKPEHDDIRSVNLEVNDFVPLFKRMHVSFLF